MGCPICSEVEEVEVVHVVGEVEVDAGVEVGLELDDMSSNRRSALYTAQLGCPSPMYAPAWNEFNAPGIRSPVV
jgi:hypothetical protein